MDAFDEKIKAAASAEMKHAAVPEKTQKEIDLLLERLPEREPVQRSSFRWQPAGLAAACALAAAVILLPAVKNSGSSLMAAVGSTNGAEDAAGTTAAFDTLAADDMILAQYTADTGTSEDQAECQQLSVYGEWSSYQVQSLQQENVRYYTWNTEENELIALEDLFAAPDDLTEVWPEYSQEESEGWIVDEDGQLVLMETDGSYAADLTKYRVLLKEQYQNSFQ